MKVLPVFILLLVGAIGFCLPTFAQIGSAAIRDPSLQGTGSLLDLTNDPTGFPLVGPEGTAALVTSSQDSKVVGIVARAVAGDIQQVSGQAPNVQLSTDRLPAYCVLAGTLGHSDLVDKLVEQGKISPDPIKGKWECFAMSVIADPLPGVKRALVIVGSDRRGTAYGLFELSRIIGVSPWIWWADVKPCKHPTLFLKGDSFASNPPAVKYRGIFLNDEDWSLHPWAAGEMDSDIKDIGPKTYAHIFELLLRLRANLVWPAMHPCTKAFYHYADNPKTADDYAIVVGTSHAEPMLRNNVYEWKEFLSQPGEKPGEYRYDTNADQVDRYWRERISQSAPYESIYTVGMRGIHDSAMIGPKTPEDKRSLLARVITDQQKMLMDVLKRPLDDIPQVFCPYKEVLPIYQSGLAVPDDVTLMWPDDNHGYIRECSDPTEQKRAGGCGVYYHLSYCGAPEDYLWLCSTSPELISYEVHQGMATGADRIWVFNVRGIKPAEMETEFAMDLVWNPACWTPEKTHRYIRDWAARTFGDSFADQIASIKDEYYLLAQEGKPEHVWRVVYTQTEAEARLARYAAIDTQAQALSAKIPSELQDAYFQLVLYPVVGACDMNKKVLDAKLGRLDEAQQAYQEIIDLTKHYNHEMAGGKWNGMMDWAPRRQPAFAAPMAFIGPKGGPPLAEGKLVPVDLAKPSAQHDARTASLIRMPFLGSPAAIGRDPNSTEAMSPTDAPWIEYRVQTSGDHASIHFRCLPGHPLYSGLEYRLAISINGQPPQPYDLDAKEFSDTWKTDVLRGYAEVIVPVDSPSPGGVDLRLSFPDPGVVLTSIGVE